eukprot:Anaeramoba_ignava/a479057_92.p2 GENE.a479057_92~~a479057_92.p2  ORF type:complete len:102 (-),score=8.73 a479057_92:1228-1533(-)
MGQFEVYLNNNPKTNEKVPYLLDVQNDLLSSLNTRVVIPLAIDVNSFKGLTKEFFIENKKVYLMTSQLGTVYTSDLTTKILSLENQKEEIKSSIDFLIYGF